MTTFDQRNQQVGTQYNAGRDINVYQPPLSLTEAQRKRNRSRMLERVQAIWIDGVLEPSVQGAAQIVLTLQHKPSATVTPLWHVLQEYDKTGPLSSADTSIMRVYDHANGEVLILGEPGAGKTTLLLELTRALLERARQDETHPSPVVFILSSWAQTQQPLTEWLASELAAMYQVPRVLARSWIESDQVLPLLDGLDEVASNHRAACVQAINTYRQGHGLLPTIVCCRQTEYLALSIRLLLRTAVVVQPLTSEQIESYLTSGGEQLEGLRQTLRKDADLQALASTPLMLNVLTVAYQGTPHEITTTGSLGIKQEQIFATYVQRMLARRTISTRFTPAQTIHWLSWLAWQMKRHNQTDFYIERMQPDWLPHSRGYRVAFTVALAVVIGLIFGLLFEAILRLTFPFYGSALGQFSKQTPSWLYEFSPLIDGLIAGFITLWQKKEIKPAESISWSWTSMYQRLRRSILAKIIVIIGVLFGIMYALDTGLFMLFESAFLQENIPWFEILAKGFFAGLLTTLFFVMPWLLLIGIFAGWFSAALSKSSLIKPNQGIRNSARYSLLVGSLSGLIISLTLTSLSIGFIIVAFVPFFKLLLESIPQTARQTPNYQAGLPQLTQLIHLFTLFTGPLYIVFVALTYAVLFGLIIGLAKGGFACIQHVILRLLLLRSGALPWYYPRFLDYAAERILLRKVGGGYIFIHRLLLDYFASVEASSTEEASAIPAMSDRPPAISSAPQIDTAHREEKASPPVPSRKTGSNKANRIVTLCGVVTILLVLACSAGIFGVVQFSVVQIKANEATATAQIEANKTAEALVTTSPIAYPPQNTSPVLNDPLQDNSKGNYWDEDTSNGNCKFINRAYDINTNQVEGCIARATDFTNFIYEVQMKIIKGDGGGIIFRFNFTGAYYYFAIYQDGSYIVYAFTDGNGAVLAQGFSSAIHRGLNQTNLVAAVVHGKIIELYVNHQRVAVVGGSTYTDGQIGVIVSGSQDKQTEVIFQNAKVWTL